MRPCFHGTFSLVSDHTRGSVAITMEVWAMNSMVCLEGFDSMTKAFDGAWNGVPHLV